MKTVACCVLLALIAMSAARPTSVLADDVDVCSGKATLSTACTQVRVTRLRDASAVFKREAQGPLPAGLNAAELAEAKRYQQWLLESAQKMDRLASEGARSTEPRATTAGSVTSEGSGSPIAGGAGTSTGTNGLMQATQGMQEVQMSFNLQYLQLQNEMQNQNRSFTMVSNIMKTKHDTVKNTISNIK